jgi:two-component system phosphate regulon sensor histidine kinase PhoR
MNHKIKFLFLLALLGVVAIVAIQGYWLHTMLKAQHRELEFDVYQALNKVAENMIASNGGNNEVNFIVSRISNTIYKVDIKSSIRINELERQLRQQFDKRNIKIPIEYTIVNSESEKVIYCNVCELQLSNVILPVCEENNYFTIKLPNPTTTIWLNMKHWLASVVLAFFLFCLILFSIKIIRIQQKSNQLQSDFINAMTHEFNTPITSILLATDWLEKSEDTKTKQYAQIINTEAQRMKTNVEQILMQSKELNEYSIHKSMCSPVEIYQKTADQFMALNRTVTMITNHDKAMPAMLCDATHLSNVFANLINNAIKYNNKPRKIIEAKFTTTTDNLHISIRDNGLGIAEKEIQNGFKKFNRMNTKHANGFGLGLFYVKQIINLHHGSVWLESTVDVGTTVIIKLPTR